MTLMTVKQAAALRLMLSIEKTTKTAELVRQARSEMPVSDTEIAINIGALYDKYAMATMVLEQATLGKPYPNEQVQVLLGENLREQLRAIVRSGAYLLVNPEAADAESASLIESLMAARKPLLAMLGEDTSLGFPVMIHGPVVLH